MRQCNNAAIVETQTVASTVGIGAAIVDLRHLGGSHGDISGTNFPAVGHDTSCRRDAGSEVVEIGGIGYRQDITQCGEGNGGCKFALVGSTTLSFDFHVIGRRCKQVGERNRIGVDRDGGHVVGIGTVRNGETRSIACPADVGRVVGYVADINVQRNDAGRSEVDFQIVDIVVAIGRSRSCDVAEGDVLATASVVVEEDFMILIGSSASIVNGVDGDKGAGIVGIGHDANFQKVSGSSLFDPEFQHEVLNGSLEKRQSDAGEIV